MSLTQYQAVLLEELACALLEHFKPKPRGPTPCTTCRWHIARPAYPHVCTAHGDSATSEGPGCVGVYVYEEVAQLGCPLHETKDGGV